ncbi:MAG: L-histidine N(alpha)-methyltransferase [Deltaproteobacteria bacterium]|nr:L-histidine N(alpha)-methyltransferase [Deltaproteobacteria bacterium]
MSAATARNLRITGEDEVMTGLHAAHKRLPCRLLYDAVGANLFERIMKLDAYYPARTETQLLTKHLPVIAQQVGPEVRVIEPGVGNGVKTRQLLQALTRPTSYVPIDVVREQLEETAASMRLAVPGLDVQPLLADYTLPFQLPTPQHASRRSLVFFPGSTIGNFEPSEARQFLSMLGRLAGSDRMLLIGADATRDPAILMRAYDDEQGLTAAFDKNILTHLNRTRGATFNLDAFEHRTVWNGEASRIEMHLVSKRQQIVRIGTSSTIAFAPGESIVTEHCYKHTPQAMQALLASAGWKPRQVFTATEVPYRLWLCDPVK